MNSGEVLFSPLSDRVNSNEGYVLENRYLSHSAKAIINKIIKFFKKKIPFKNLIPSIFFQLKLPIHLELGC